MAIFFLTKKKLTSVFLRDVEEDMVSICYTGRGHTGKRPGKVDSHFPSGSCLTQMHSKIVREIRTEKSRKLTSREEVAVRHSDAYFSFSMTRKEERWQWDNRERRNNSQRKSPTRSTVDISAIFILCVNFAGALFLDSMIILLIEVYLHVLHWEGRKEIQAENGDYQYCGLDFPWTYFPSILC